VFAFIVESFLMAENKILASEQSTGQLIVFISEVIGQATKPHNYLEDITK